MRTLHLIVLFAAIAMAAGCESLRSWLTDANRPRGAVESVSAEKLVKYLNNHAAALQSIEYESVQVRVYAKGWPSPIVEGSLACAQPRYFRMNVGKMSATVDVGSNQEQFWAYTKIPTQEPDFVYASHIDYETGRAKLPGNLPFDTDWVMQAFGMATFPMPGPEGAPVRTTAQRPTSVAASPPPTDRISVTINQKDRTYTLVWPTTAPGGTRVLKEVVFDADPVTGTRPQVRKHVVRDATTMKVIATAEIKAVQSVSVTNPITKAATAIQYPTRAVLKWEELNFETDMWLDRAHINQPLVTDSRKLFTRPVIRGAQPFNLAGGVDFPPQ